MKIDATEDELAETFWNMDNRTGTPPFVYTAWEHLDEDRKRAYLTMASEFIMSLSVVVGVRRSKGG